MKAELNIDHQELVKEITQAVVNALRPFLNKKEDDILLTVSALADYLGVTKGWIYKRTMFKEIPHYKKGHFVTFKKTEIDAWLNSQRVPDMNPLSSPLKVIK